MEINRKINSGFTIIETLVAIFILSMAVTATQFFLTSSIRSATTIKNNYMASLLAQEGMEVARNLRDSEWLATETFGNTLPDGAWNVQWNSQALIPFADVFLKKNAASGLFNYNGGADTIYKRRVDVATVLTVPPGIEKKIMVTVSWKEFNQIKTLVAEEHLFNWH